MSRLQSGDDVRVEVDGIGRASILRLAFRGQIEAAGSWIDDHVLEHAAEAVRGRPDFRLGLLREPNDLRIAAALEVEPPVGRPAMLVVADQRPLRIGRKRRFAGTRKPEEDGDVTVGSFVRSAVHREDSAQRHQVVHDRENRLLDLACVTRAADQYHLAREVDQNERAAARAVTGGFGAELGRVDHRELRREIARRLVGRQEQVAREERMPSVLRDDPDRQAVARIGAHVRIHNVDVALAQIGADSLQECVEMGGVDRTVGFAPVNVMLAACFANEKFIFR